MMEVGLRVVRGPGWKWQNQDSGEGHVGTVVEIGKPGNSNTPDKTVVVQWDSGFRTNYRVGYQGAYDLRVYDNAATGKCVKHPNIICDECKKQGIHGMRWKCLSCHDFDLCQQCYFGDKHDLKHSFKRYDSASSTGVKVSKRASAVKIQARGIFNGAKVVRGPDWDWGNQDGGEGKPGKVVDIRGWDHESGRSVANVTWMNGSTNVYRLGHKGKVDLKYIEDASGGYYYRDHLPVLGEASEVLSSSTTHHQFKVGDKVRVDLDVEILKAMQEGHGGWNPRMADYVGMIGTVHRITERGDVRVQYEGCGNRWTFHPGALTKVYQFSVGDSVQISDDATKVRDLQKGHGEWIDSMRNALGKVGKVLKVYADGDLRVSFGSQVWTFNSAACHAIPHHEQDENNTLTRASDRDNHPNALEAIMEQLLEQQAPSTEPDRLVREAAQGHVDVVKDIITKSPDKVNEKSSGKSALQVASHQGHRDIVMLLLSAGANLELPDEDGDTALHYSAFGNQPEITELLLKRGANINALNSGGCSALHVAVNKQHTQCVSVLLKHKCDVNIQDSYGDTALHDAIGKGSEEIVDILVSYPGIDFRLRNKRGFNVLHHAALKGNNHATSKILQKTRQIVDVQKEDGFAALHLAALNGHIDVVNTLITTGKAELEIYNNRHQTPLLLAVSPWSHGHPAVVELLVAKGAKVNVQDEDGNSCLHLALMRGTTASLDMQQAPTIAKIHDDLVSELGSDAVHIGLSIACFLVSKGAELKAANHHCKLAQDVSADHKIIEILKKYAHWHQQGLNKQKKTSNMHVAKQSSECIVCSDAPASVTFEPCGHRVACAECCQRMKKCLVCKEIINKKIGKGQSPVSTASDEREEKRQLLELQQKVQELEDTVNCSICLENPRSVVFLCGHSTCAKCAQPLTICHMCRKEIKKKINLF